jgi:hypothetical protein
MMRSRILLFAPWIALLASCASREPAPASSPVVVAVVPAPSTAPEPPAPPISALQPLPPAEPEPQAPSPFDALAPDAAAPQPVSTPPFIVKSAVVISANAGPNDPLGGDKLMLFEAPVSCAAAANAPTSLSLSLQWKVGNKLQFSQLTYSNGTATSYKGSIEVLKAPKTKGAKGKIRLDHVADGNVEGGEVEAIWCG